MFVNNQTYTVNIPPEFNFQAEEVYVNKIGDVLMITPVSRLAETLEHGAAILASYSERKNVDMCQVMINVPHEVLFDTHMSADEAAVFARKMVALGYYTQNNISIGYCAEIAGMTEE